LVLGAGFAGLWAAIGAARKIDQIGPGASEVEILVVDRNDYHNIRVRNYEVDLSDVTIRSPMCSIRVNHMRAEVQAVDPSARHVTVETAVGQQCLTYDRLVLTLGSQLVRPAIPGLAVHGYDVDTYVAATRLDAHLEELGKQAPSEGAPRLWWSVLDLPASRSRPKCPPSWTGHNSQANVALYSLIQMRMLA